LFALKYILNSLLYNLPLIVVLTIDCFLIRENNKYRKLSGKTL
jgi:hypothetical protein